MDRKQWIPFFFVLGLITTAGKRERYQSELGLSESDASALADDQAVALYFEEAVGAGSDPGEACKWLIGDIAGYLNRYEKNTIQRDKIMVN